MRYRNGTNLNNICYGKVRMLLIALCLLITPFSTFSGGIDDAAEIPARVPDMGMWEQLDNESVNWPAGLDPDECHLMYREDEWVVFHRVPGTTVDVWSYFELNETWIKYVTQGAGPDPSILARGFSSNTNGTTAYFFGGYIGQYDRQDDFDIFHYETMTWESRSVPSSLTPRYLPSMAYDDTTDSIWIFGGRRSGGDENDLHQFNFTDGWNNPQPSVKPYGRNEAGLTLSSDGTFIYMALGKWYQGGSGGGWRYLHSLWSYDVINNVWAEMDDDLRDDGVITSGNSIFQYVNGTDDLIMSMGYGNDDNDVHLHQTYRIDRNDATVTKVNLTGVIPRRVGAWDILPDGRTAVVLGGIDGPRDGWKIDLETLETEPMPFNPMLYDGTSYTGFDPEGGGKLTLLRASSVSYGDSGDDFSSWQLAYFSIADNTWNQVKVNMSVAPVYHQGMSGCYDPVGNHFYLFGGLDSHLERDGWDWITVYDAFYKEFWRLSIDDGKWEQLLFNPPQGERAGAALVCDADNRMIYSFGGNISAGGVDSTMARYDIDQARWDLINPVSRLPGPRKDGKMAMYSNVNGFFLYGGVDGIGDRSDLLWFYDTAAETWQQLQILKPGGVAPAGRINHAICIVPDTGEVMILGDPVEDDSLFLWRPFVPWTEWKSESLPLELTDLKGHGMFHSTDTGSVYVFGGDGRGLQVMEYSPIMRTIVNQLKLFGPDDERSSNAYPTVGEYQIWTYGVTDVDEGDLLGVDLWLNGGGVNGYINMTKAGNGYTSEGDWFEVTGEPTFSFLDGEWNVSIPLEFNFNMSDGGGVDVTATPITATSYAESGRTVNLFTMHSSLEVVGYKFRTDLQSPAPFSNDGYLFGNTDLTVQNITVAFKDNPDMHPLNQSLVISLFNGFNDTASWDYVKGEEGMMSVPIKGSDKEIVTFVLSLATSGGEELWNQTFDFMLDLDPPAIPTGLALRADTITDARLWVDNDQEMFLTWDGVVELGAGLRGVCYSLDKNLYPAESNLTTTSPKTIYPISEGIHRIYVWTVDKAGRAGPLFDHEVIVDTHLPLFANETVPELLNITYGSFVVGISVYDELSGVDPERVQYQYTLPSKQYSNWMNVPGNITGAPGEWESISVHLDLVPGIKNYVQFRVKDRAGSDWRISLPMAVYYNPELGVPLISVNPQGNNTIVEKVGASVDLLWDANYINPENLSYSVEVKGPDGSIETFDDPDKGMEYTPEMPGKYRWWVTALADGLSTRSIMMAFTFEPPFASAEVPVSAKIPFGSDVELLVKVTNDLEADTEFSIIISSGNGLEITGGGVFTVPAGGVFNNTLIINGSAAPAGGQSVKLLLSDEYGRSREYTLTVTVLAAPEEKNGQDAKDTDLMSIIIAAIVGLLVIIAIIAFIFMRKKGEKEDETEDDAPKEEYDDEYDPTGKVAYGEEKDISSITTSPGLPGREGEERARGSNVMELTVPASEERVKKPKRRKTSARKKAKSIPMGQEEVTGEMEQFSEGDLEEFNEDDLEEVDEMEELEEYEE